MSDLLLGVPRDTLEEAMLICQTRKPLRTGHVFNTLQRDQKGWFYVTAGRLGNTAHNIPTWVAVAMLEHAFREWLVEYSCEVVSNLVCNLVWLLNENGKRIKIISSHGSNLTTQAMAVVESGVKPK